MIMREIKFRSWVKNKDIFRTWIRRKHPKGKMYTGFSFPDIYAGRDESSVSCGNDEWEEPNWEDAIIMQYTGLKDKSNNIYIYDGDFIDKEGNIRGNIYENKDLYKKGTDFLLITMETKTWGSTIKEAIRRGCKHAK